LKLLETAPIPMAFTFNVPAMSSSQTLKLEQVKLEEVNEIVQLGLALELL